jgi:predicted RNase H-like HicB family nuclease
MGGGTAVGLEVSDRKVFAWALDWPGWCRAGKTEEDALEALATYLDRYAPVARRAGERLPKTAGRAFDVRERVTGDATTEFGAPGAVAAADREKVTPAMARRQAALLRAAWAVLDEVAAASSPELRKGPRGGGRDRDKMLAHVVDAESSYARKIGVKYRAPAFDDAAGLAAVRAEILAVLGAPSDGAPPVPNGWPPRYAARRLVWHVLDHAWEMEDRQP